VRSIFEVRRGRPAARLARLPALVHLYRTPVGRARSRPCTREKDSIT
jgi:hypothetical protein